MDTLTYILDKFDLMRERDEPGKYYMPIEIPDFGREGLAVLLADLGFSIGAEVGVEQGVYSEILLKANPKLHLICVDAWKAHKGYKDHTRQSKLDNFYQITWDRLQPFKNRVTIRKGFSMEVVNLYDDESLDFVYIDANHSFINVAEDIYYWSKKVKKGGIIAGHDYVTNKEEAPHVHVKEVLDGYTKAYGITPWFVLGSEEKVEGQVRDDTRSWMFIKQ